MRRGGLCFAPWLFHVLQSAFLILEVKPWPSALHIWGLLKLTHNTSLHKKHISNVTVSAVLIQGPVFYSVWSIIFHRLQLSILKTVDVHKTATVLKMLGLSFLLKRMKAQQARQVKDGLFSFSGKFLFKKREKCRSNSARWDLWWWQGRLNNTFRLNLASAEKVVIWLDLSPPADV